MADIGENRANELLAGLQDKAKEPNSVRVLSSWIDRAERDLGAERSGRIAWLVASTVVAAIQTLRGCIVSRVVDAPPE